MVFEVNKIRLPHGSVIVGQNSPQVLPVSRPLSKNLINAILLISIYFATVLFCLFWQFSLFRKRPVRINLFNKTNKNRKRG